MEIMLDRPMSATSWKHTCLPSNPLDIRIANVILPAPAVLGEKTAYCTTRRETSP